MKLERGGTYLYQSPGGAVENWTCMGKIPGEDNYLCFCLNGNGTRFFREFTEDGLQILYGSNGFARQLLKELPKPKVKKEGWIAIAIKDSVLGYNNMPFRMSSAIMYDKTYVEGITFTDQQIVKVEWEE